MAGLCHALCHLVFLVFYSESEIQFVDLSRLKMPLRLQTFQSALRSNAHLLRHTQRRWAQVHDVRFLASHHDPKYVLEKYRSKLDQKAKE